MHDMYIVRVKKSALWGDDKKWENVRTEGQWNFIETRILNLAKVKSCLKSE